MPVSWSRWLPGLVVLSAVTQADALAVRIAYVDIASPPYILGNGTQTASPPGVAVTLMQEAAQACQLQPRWSRLPSKRLLAMLHADEIDISFLYAFLPERQTLFAYPMLSGQPDRRLRMTSLTYSLYVRRDSPLRFDGQSWSHLTGKIGVNTGWSIGEDLRARQLPVEEASDTEANFRKLLAGHIAAYATQDHLGDSYLAAHPLADVIKLQPPLSRKDYFAVVSHGWLQRHPAESQCLWQQIARLRELRLPPLLAGNVAPRSR